MRGEEGVKDGMLLWPEPDGESTVLHSLMRDFSHSVFITKRDRADPSAQKGASIGRAKRGLNFSVSQ